MSETQLIGPVELKVDLPIEMGCFAVPNIDELGAATTTDTMTPAECAITCSQNSKIIFALMQGNQCFCMEEDQILSLAPAIENKCDVNCEGDSLQLCGGATVASVFVSKCDENWVRFGDSCYVKGYNTNLIVAEDSCLNQGAHIWWPESSHEIKWLSHVFGGDYDMYIGYQSYSDREGFLAYDYSKHLGIPFYTHDKIGTKLTWLGTETYKEYFPVLEDGKVQTGISYKIDSDEFEIVDTCANMTAVCKKKINLLYQNVLNFGEPKTVFGSSFSCDDPYNRMSNITYPKSSLSTSRRRWRVVGLVNTEPTRDISSVENQIEVTIPVTLLNNNDYTVGNKHKFSISFSSWSQLTGIDILSLQYAVKEKAAETAPDASNPTLIEVR